jgi:hypothetical protein
MGFDIGGVYNPCRPNDRLLLGLLARDYATASSAMSLPPGMIIGASPNM